MRTSSRNLAVVLFDEVELLDFAGAVEVFTTAGRQWNWRPFRIWTVADAARPVETRNQVRVEAAVSFDECPAPEVLFVPGGYGARRKDVTAAHVEWIRQHGPNCDVVAASGNGVLLLARAGLLEGARVSAPAEVESELRDLAPGVTIETDPRVVEYDKLVTAKASASAMDVALAVVARLLGQKQATGVARHLDYAWGTDALAPEPLRVEIKTDP